ncbi:hypothetical protein P0Y35_10720 [Kiritimatiellaeota bacterium B1221]|nr:hypothetical protein [Kiritimatiellaeota bacterium B1221]
MTAATHPYLSEHLFWDVDPEQVDVEVHAGFLIPRIMDRGTMKDVDWAWNYYDHDRIKQILLHAPSLHKKTIAFFSAQFQVPLNAFRAYRNRNQRWTA